MTRASTVPRSDRFALPEIRVRLRSDGGLEVSSITPPQPHPSTTLHWLARWAEQTPEAVLLTEVVDRDRREYSYREAWEQVGAEARALREYGLDAGERVAVIAPNSFMHFVLGHAAMLVGAIYVPIAAQYAAEGADPQRLAGVIELIEPALIVAAPDSEQRFARARGSVVTGLRSRPADDGSGAAFARTWLERMDPDVPTKLLLTSGSTGTPKAVIYTPRMLVANAQATAQVWPFSTGHPPILVDWLPWNHAFGGNANLSMVLLAGGTLHIDPSRGRPEAFAESIATIKRLRPSYYAAVPAGFQQLLPVLRDDRELREALLGGCEGLFSAGAAMPAPTFEALRELSLTVRNDGPIPILSGWGSTEVGPGATIVHTDASRPGWIGTPLPGVTVKLVPVAEKLELRVKGPSVMPGYWGQPELTETVFDDEGFYCSGDAGLLVDPSRPELGLRFDGRIANDFKLANGSWVNVERIRESLLALAGDDVRDVVIVGPDRPHLVAVFWVERGARLDLAGILDGHNSVHHGQTNAVRAARAIDEELAAEFLTPKGTIKAALFRAREARHFDDLYFE